MIKYASQQSPPFWENDKTWNVKHHEFVFKRKHINVTKNNELQIKEWKNYNSSFLILSFLFFFVNGPRKGKVASGLRNRVYWGEEEESARMQRGEEQGLVWKRKWLTQNWMVEWEVEESLPWHSR